MTPAEHCAAALATLQGHHDLAEWARAVTRLRDNLPDVLQRLARLEAMEAARCCQSYSPS